MLSIACRFIKFIQCFQLPVVLIISIMFPITCHFTHFSSFNSGLSLLFRIAGYARLFALQHLDNQMAKFIIQLARFFSGILRLIAKCIFLDKLFSLFDKSNSNGMQLQRPERNSTSVLQLCSRRMHYIWRKCGCADI